MVAKAVAQFYRKGSPGLQELEGWPRLRGPGSSGHRCCTLARCLQSSPLSRHSSLRPGSLSQGPRPIIKGPVDISTWIRRLLEPPTHGNSPPSSIKISPWFWLLNFLHENHISLMTEPQNLSLCVLLLVLYQLKVSQAVPIHPDDSLLTSNVLSPGSPPYVTWCSHCGVKHHWVTGLTARAQTPLPVLPTPAVPWDSVRKCLRPWAKDAKWASVWPVRGFHFLLLPRSRLQKVSDVRMPSEQTLASQSQVLFLKLTVCVHCRFLIYL